MKRNVSQAAHDALKEYREKQKIEAAIKKDAGIVTLPRKPWKAPPMKANEKLWYDMLPKDFEDREFRPWELERDSYCGWSLQMDPKGKTMCMSHSLYFAVATLDTTRWRKKGRLRILYKFHRRMNRLTVPHFKASLRGTNGVDINGIKTFIMDTSLPQETIDYLRNRMVRIINNPTLSKVG